MNEDWDIDKIDERFFVHGRMEILDILTDLVFRDEPITVCFNGGGERRETRLLDARERMFVFDCDDAPETNQRLSESSRCVFSAFPDGIRVQFAATQISPIPWDDKIVFCAALPDRLARLQRQESFRVHFKPENAPLVRLFSADGVKLGQWPLHDISTDGLAITTDVADPLVFAQTIGGVAVTLPADYGDVDCGIALRHATVLNKEISGYSHRIGMKFSNLPIDMRASIQRYIIQSEYEKRRTEAGNNLDQDE
ncbi:MAG: flagellar brake protein [Burkholderiales bacterium]|nr:flagellar brake protein [Burkholderiales bacterium]